jgi:hypothetical protein
LLNIPLHKDYHNIIDKYLKTTIYTEVPKLFNKFLKNISNKTKKYYLNISKSSIDKILKNNNTDVQKFKYILDHLYNSQKQTIQVKVRTLKNKNYIEMKNFRKNFRGILQNGILSSLLIN